MNSRDDTLATSLDADEALVPFLPELLKDLWSLGFLPEPVIEWLGLSLQRDRELQVLDLGCGKGALLIGLAKAFGWYGRGVDIVPQFIDEARQRASELGVADLTAFDCGDMAAFLTETCSADLVVFGFDSEALGSLESSLSRIRPCVRTDGHLLLDTAWSNPGLTHEGILDEEATRRAIADAGYAQVAHLKVPPDEVARQNHANTEKIRARALALARKHPERRSLFEGYVAAQEAESRTLNEELTCVSLLLSVERG